MQQKRYFAPFAGDEDKFLGCTMFLLELHWPLFWWWKGVYWPGHWQRGCCRILCELGDEEQYFFFETTCQEGNTNLCHLCGGGNYGIWNNWWVLTFLGHVLAFKSKQFLFFLNLNQRILKICLNSLCPAKETHQWRRPWKTLLLQEIFW